MTGKVDVIVVGAGVVGLAVARGYAQAGRDVLIVEQESAIGLHSSSRNSEVIHAGIYDEPLSLKAKLCSKGKTLLYAYCAQMGVSFKKNGKLIVAQSKTEIGKLQTLLQNARACGVDDLIWLDGAEAMKLEPELHCVAALLSPSTGLIASGQLMLTLLGDAEAAGATLALNSKVGAGKLTSDGVSLTIESSNEEPLQMSASLVINCAGHGAHEFAKSIAGYDTATPPARFLAKGTYCSVSGRSPFSHHIYPVPVQGGLGTHVTNDMGGSAKLGPDVRWIADLNYEVDQQIGESFKSSCEGFWPGIRDRDVTPTYCGVRPKLSGPGEPSVDFQIQRVGERHHAKLINLFGIESPGLTSSLAIAEYLLGGP